MTGRTILRCMMAGALALTLSACSGDDNDNGTSASPSPAAQATTAATSGGSTGATAAATTAAAATATSAAAGTTAPGGTAAASTLTIRAGEQGDAFFFEPKDVTARAGRITLNFTNAGPQRRHTYVIRDSAGQEVFKSNEVEPNNSQTAEFTIAQAGQYTVLCVLPGHANRGQQGTLTVTN